MTLRTTPPFRADHVGSFLRPKFLLEAREQKAKGEITPEAYEREKDIYREQAKATGKPANVVEKIVEGKMAKFYEEVCLLDQPFRDGDETVGQLITNAIATIGENIRVRRFVRYALGEELSDLQERLFANPKVEVIWNKLVQSPFESGEAVERWVLAQPGCLAPEKLQPQPHIDTVFGLPTVHAMLQALEGASDEWSQKTAQTLRARSPLMLNVVLEQIRRARGMGLAEDLRMERDMVHHCFHLRAVAESETVEGIRALAVDKDHSPQWKPARVEAVDAAEVARFFVSPWPADHHPLRHLA